MAWSTIHWGSKVLGKQTTAQVLQPETGDNRHLHAELTAAKVPHIYREFSGGHTWGYWDVHVQESLAFHAENLRLEK